MRKEAVPIEFGNVRVRVEWRDLGYDAGIAIRVDVESPDGRFAPAAKFDAFYGNPHWHLFSRDRMAERVHPLDRDDPLSRCMELLELIPGLLVQAGYREAASDLVAGDIAEILLPRVRLAIESVRPTTEQM